MSRLIDADALDKRIYNDIPISVFGSIKKMSAVREIIAEQPTVEAVPKTELFELFDRITTAWNGKQRFFPQEDGTIYDRNMCDYIKSFEDAVNRFCNELSDG